MTARVSAPALTASLMEKATARVLNSKSSTVSMILAYMVGTQHPKVFGTLLRILITLGASVDSN